MPAKSLKAADKQTILKKLVTEMKKRYGGSIPKQNRSVFETLLFAACLEDVGYEQAEAAYTRLLDGFFDLNEIRVSSVNEIEQALGEIEYSDWKAMRIREALQFVFEKHYSFDLEQLKRKTQEQAQKELVQIPHQTAFIRAYGIQHSLAAHLIPVDTRIHQLLVWLGLAEEGSDAEAVGDDLKSGVKKTDAPLLCYLLKCTSTDPELKGHFSDGPVPGETDPFTAAQRLVDLFKNPKKKRKPAKPVPVKASEKHTEKGAGKVAEKATEKPVPAGKAVSRKKPEKKVTANRAVASKTAPASSRKVTKKVPPKKVNRSGKK
ncbi:MAG TPA: hypothetical protein VNQ76_03855 [Planctomicrobium sp.]|nr:hypothetical protein [Planctomicrobium sp.]